MSGVTTAKIREWATALPEVTEKQHHLFKVPVWQVRGRTFLGMGRDESTAVFCIPEESANAAAAADPANAAAVRRQNAQRSFLGLEVRLAEVPAERLEAWVREAWATQAPKTVVKQHEQAP
ncbi:MAG TPA: MmcQ/YjbR family DNA-binding protein [Amycolatopsis sp.]|nr:MmcQ/YjbR family DNA-binding protein [Amycolatopsis sp.]